MLNTNPSERRRLEKLDADELGRYQLDRLNQLLDEILPENGFYAEKFAETRVPLSSLDELSQLPFTFKEELIGSTADDFAVNRTYSLEDYSRFHRTSGTRGHPLVVLDTDADWQWWIDTWQFVLDAAELRPDDRVLMAFSFGPFIGFWSAYDAAAARGCLVIPAGGFSTLSRLELIRGAQATVLMCTPSYALHLVETANENQVNLANSSIEKIIVAGEPGGSIPEIRQEIEQAWGAQLIDHSGATEVGPWGYAHAGAKGLHVIESEFIAEFLSIETGEAAAEGELSELVLTTLGRAGCPVIRYRTGDLVKPTWNESGANRFVLLEGGVLGRVDDMMIIRGVNIFPSSVEKILRSFPEIVEYRMTAHKVGQMDALSVEVEDRMEEPTRIARELQLRLGLKVDVKCVPLGTLPRFELKGKRFVDNR